MSEQKESPKKEVGQYAVIETGGKQYRVSVGDKIIVGKIEADSGSEIVFDKVLAYRGEEKDGKLVVGKPFLEGATVKAKTLRQMKDKKIDVFKKTRRQGFTKKIGHRQDITAIEVTAITTP